MIESNLLKDFSLVCILQVSEVRITSYVGTSPLLWDLLRWGQLVAIRMLVELCQLHGELLQQEHEASAHSNVVQIHLDC